MHKLRLVLFPECYRSCEGCCNDSQDLEGLPIVNSVYDDYDEIMLTGGDPMMKPLLVMSVIQQIRVETDNPIFMYTAKSKPIMPFLMVLSQIDGITLTLHERPDILAFVRLNKEMEQYPELCNKSLRVNVISHVWDDLMAVMRGGQKFDHWTLVNKEWMDECPVPENELLARYWK